MSIYTIVHVGLLLFGLVLMTVGIDGALGQGAKVIEETRDRFLVALQGVAMGFVAFLGFLFAVTGLWALLMTI